MVQSQTYHRLIYYDVYEIIEKPRRICKYKLAYIKENIRARFAAFQFEPLAISPTTALIYLIHKSKIYKKLLFECSYLLKSYALFKNIWVKKYYH